jgi:hypothetical protein
LRPSNIQPHLAGRYLVRTTSLGAGLQSGEYRLFHRVKSSGPAYSPITRLSPERDRHGRPRFESAVHPYSSSTIIRPSDSGLYPIPSPGGFHPLHTEGGPPMMKPNSDVANRAIDRILELSVDTNTRDVLYIFFTIHRSSFIAKIASHSMWPCRRRRK